jgi:hypothetical protein
MECSKGSLDTRDTLEVIYSLGSFAGEGEPIEIVTIHHHSGTWSKPLTSSATQIPATVCIDSISYNRWVVRCSRTADRGGIGGTIRRGSRAVDNVLESGSEKAMVVMVVGTRQALLTVTLCSDDSLISPDMTPVSLLAIM